MAKVSPKTVKWLLVMTTFIMTACSTSPQADLQSVTSDTTSKQATVQAQKLPRQAALEVARTMLGTPYRYGGTDPRGFDCSGLVQYSFHKAGIPLPRTSRDIFRSSQLVPPTDRRPGDLVFFAITKGKVSHVGIFSGGGQFIHAPSSGKGVSYASLNNPYWRSRLVGVGRFP